MERLSVSQMRVSSGDLGDLGQTWLLPAHLEYQKVFSH